MAKILNSVALKGNISKMIELGDNLIINGHSYDKNTFSPISLDFCPVTVTAFNEMILSQTTYVRSPWIKNKTTNGYIVDNTNPNIYYCVSQSSLASGGSIIYKLTKDNNAWTMQSFETFLSTGRALIDIVSQDNQKVYFTVNRDTSASYSYLGYVNKATMIGTYININTANIKVLKDTDMYIYFATAGVSNSTHYVGKYNKVTNSVTWISTDTVSSSYYSEIEPSNMDGEGIFYTVRDGFSFGNTDHFIAYRKNALDINKDTVNIATVTVDTSILDNKHVFSKSSMQICNALYDFTDPNTGKKYMTHIIYNKGTDTITLNSNESAMYTYEIKDENNWKLVSYNKFNPIVYNAILPVLNNQTLMIGYENGCHIYTWDTGTTSYKKVSAFDSPVIAMGCDSNNNLYIQYSDSSIEMVSNVMPVTVFADFNKDVYDYNGEDISTAITVYVKNYQGKYLSTSLQINLYGNCKFTDDSSRIKKITTSNLDVLTIPVTITDSGNLKVAVKAL